MDQKPQGSSEQQSVENPYNAPMAEVVKSSPLGPVDEGDATGGMIPYKNPHALIAYYLGIVSLLPLVGAPFGLASFILGIIGLRKRKQNPKIKGSVHAWIGIVFGLFSMLCGAGILFSIIVTAAGVER
jgi:hypothetical protein